MNWLKKLKAKDFSKNFRFKSIDFRFKDIKKILTDFNLLGFFLSRE